MGLKKHSAGSKSKLVPITLVFLLILSTIVVPSLGRTAGVGAVQNKGTKTATPILLANNALSGIPDSSQNYAQSQSANSVKYTLFLSNNSLLLSNVGPNNLSNGINVYDSYLGTSLFDGSNGILYIANTYTSQILAFNTSKQKLTKVIQVGVNPHSMALDYLNGFLYVANIGSQNLTVINTTSNTVARNIYLGFEPSGIIFDTSNLKLYMSDLANGTLDEFNPVNSSFVANFSVSSLFLFHITFCNLNNMIYGTGAGNTIYGVNASSGRTVALLNGASNSVDVYFNRYNGLLYDIDYVGGTVGVINPVTNTWVGNFTLSPYPTDTRFQGITGTSVDGNVYVTDGSTNSVTVFNATTGRHVAEIPAGTDPSAILYNDQSKLIYVINTESPSITIIDPLTNKVTANVELSPSPTGMTYDPVNSAIYVANAASNQLLKIDSGTNLIVGRVHVGYAPNGLAYDPLNQHIYVANSGSNNVSVIDTTTNSVIATIEVGFTPMNIIFDPANSCLYVTDGNSNNVSIINSSSNVVSQSVTVGFFPNGIAYDSLNKLVYVTNFWSNNMSVINSTTNKVVYNVGVGYQPSGIAFDPINGNMNILNYVNPAFADTVMNSNNALVNTEYFADVPSAVGYGGGNVIFDSTDRNLYATIPELNQVQAVASYPSTNVPAGKVSVGQYPNGIAFNPRNSYVYVSNSYSGSLSVITTGSFYNVTFNEIGLPSGMKWTVGIVGNYFSTTASSLSLLLPNGTFNYSVSASSVEWGTPSSVGKITVGGTSVAISFPFSTVFLVTFSESGMPKGYGWEVLIHNQTHSSYSYEIGFYEPNGSYGYFLYEVVNSSTKYIQAGSFAVRGQNLTVNVNLSPYHLLLDQVLTYLIPAVVFVAVAMAAVFGYRLYRKRHKI